jgi:Fe2+ transport system protein FeoA
MTEKVFNQKIEIVKRAMEQTISHSLEDIGITAGSTLWKIKRQEAQDYFIECLNRLTKKE